MLLTIWDTATKKIFGFECSEQQSPMYSAATVNMEGPAVYTKSYFSRQCHCPYPVRAILSQNKPRKLASDGSQCFTSYFQPVVTTWKWWTRGSQSDSVAETRRARNRHFFVSTNFLSTEERYCLLEGQQVHETKEEARGEKRKYVLTNGCKTEREIKPSDTLAGQKRTLQTQISKTIRR